MGSGMAATVEADEEAERSTLHLDGTAAAGAWKLEIAFDGILNDDLRGFYRSVYTDPNGAEKTIATTQFEATEARRAFPCWDEPDLKATYGVTLIVDDGLTAISNGAEAERTDLGGGKVAVRFVDTIKMSTYLVAFIVGELDVTDPIDVDGNPLRIVYPPGKGNLTDFALDAAAHSLRYYAEYYDIPYPGGKMDKIAIPDFAWGAMENMGAVTYRETALLVDPRTATQTEMMRVAEVIAHEIAHMWFGDLVTMKWWNGIWLNEAFATFASMKCIDAYRPDWKLWLDVLIGPCPLDGDRRPCRDSANRDPRCIARRGERHVRLAHVREGRIGAPDARTVSRRRSVPPRREQLSEGERVRKHRRGRSVVRPCRSFWRTRQGDHGHLDLPGRVPAGRC